MVAQESSRASNWGLIGPVIDVIQRMNETDQSLVLGFALGMESKVNSQANCDDSQPKPKKP